MLKGGELFDTIKWKAKTTLFHDQQAYKPLIIFTQAWYINYRISTFAYFLHISGHLLHLKNSNKFIYFYSKFQIREIRGFGIKLN